MVEEVSQKRVVGNGLMDLWAEFRLLDMGKRLGRFIGQYRTDYFLPDKRSGQVIFTYKPLPDAEQRIYDKIADITISMKSSDHLTMPKLVSSEYTVRLNPLEREIYQRLKQEMVLSMTDGSDSEITAANAAALAGKLSQMANGAVSYGFSVWRGLFSFQTVNFRFCRDLPVKGGLRL